MNTNQRYKEISRLKYVTLVNYITFIVFGMVLLAASIFSLWQTVIAFLPTADPGLVAFGIRFGDWLPYIYGLIVQYGQNVTLYIKNKYCSDDVIFYFGESRRKFTQKTIAWIVFWSLCTVDAATNILWYYKSVESTGDKVTDLIVGFIGYSLMVGLIFSEELLGIVFQSIRDIRLEFRSILAQERGVSGRIANRDGYNSNGDMSKHQSFDSLTSRDRGTNLDTSNNHNREAWSSFRKPSQQTQAKPATNTGIFSNLNSKPVTKNQEEKKTELQREIERQRNARLAGAQPVKQQVPSFGKPINNRFSEDDIIKSILGEFDDEDDNE